MAKQGADSGRREAGRNEPAPDRVIFPDMQLEEVDGSTRPTLKSLTGNNGTVVVLFNDLCTGCVRQLEVVEGLSKGLPSDVCLVRVGVFSTSDGVHNLLERHGIPGPVYLTTRTDVLHLLGEHELPLTYVLEKDEAGNLVIRQVHRGVLEDPDGFVRELAANFPS